MFARWVPAALAAVAITLMMVGCPAEGQISGSPDSGQDDMRTTTRPDLGPITPPASCVLNARRCVSSTAYEVCSPGLGGALSWGSPLPCAGGGSCSGEGVCSSVPPDPMDMGPAAEDMAAQDMPAGCQSTCTQGQKVCVDDGNSAAYFDCVQVDEMCFQANMAETKMCAGGACMAGDCMGADSGPNCEPGNCDIDGLRCSGDRLQICEAQGNSCAWSPARTCQNQTACVSAPVQGGAMRDGCWDAVCQSLAFDGARCWDATTEITCRAEGATFSFVSLRSCADCSGTCS